MTGRQSYGRPGGAGDGRAYVRRGPAAGFAAMLLGLFAMVAVSAAEAAEIRLGTVIPGAGVVRKNVLSARERRYVNLVQQETDFSCGAASLATILKYAYDRDVTEKEVLLGMLEVSDEEVVRERGFSLLDLKRYAEKVGLRGVGLKLEAQHLDKIVIPTIVLLDIRGYKHFVVFKKAKGDRVYVGDPALGNKVMSRSDFVAAWNGIILALVGEDFDEQTVLLQPAEPLSARRLLAGGSAPHQPANTIGFGVEHSVLFQF